MKFKNGFTLIELLVVVLIIGILAAIALPTYMNAVEKSRASEAIVLLKKLLDAESVYYLANGGYTKDLNALDITMPNISSDEDDNIRSYGKNFIVGVSYAHSDMIVAQAERIGVASGKRYYINLRRNNAGGEALWCTSSWGAYMPTSDNLPNAEWAALCKAISNGKKNGVSYNTLVEE